MGLVGELDLRQAELNVSRTASFIPALREALAAAVNRTAVLLGEYPSQLHAELREPAPIPLPEAEVAVGLPAELLRQRPDLRAAERQLAAQSARIGVATADLYPRLALLGSFSFDAISTASWFTSGAQAWNIGPQLRWNLFDGGRIRSNVRAQEALTRQALAGYEQTVLLAVEEVENSLAGYAEERARVEELRRGVRAAEQTVRAGPGPLQDRPGRLPERPRLGAVAVRSAGPARWRARAASPRTWSASTAPWAVAGRRSRRENP